MELYFFLKWDSSLPFRNWLCDGADHPCSLLEAELRRAVNEDADIITQDQQLNEHTGKEMKMGPMRRKPTIFSWHMQILITLYKQF